MKNPSKIFLIQELKCDSYENNSVSALFYKTIGFVIEQNLAEQIVTAGGMLKKDWCWPMHQDMPRFRYSVVQRIMEDL